MAEITINDKSSIESQRTIDERGYMTILNNRVARAGVQYYLGAEFLPEDLQNISKELGRDIGVFDKLGFYRPEDVVFSKNVLDSYDNVDVTLDHPYDKIVDAESYEDKEVVGHVISPGRRSGNWMLVDLMIKSKKGTDAIDSGKVGLSAAYTSTFKPKCGITDSGEKYDMILESVIPNHIAICQVGRAGPEARLSDSKPEIKNMAVIKLADGSKLELNEDNVASIQLAINDAESRAQKVEAELSKVEADRDRLADENEKLKVQTADEAVNEKLKELLVARDGAQLLTGKIVDSASLDANEIRANALDEAGIKCRYTDSGKWADADAAKVEARFDTEVDARAESKQEEAVLVADAETTHQALAADAVKAHLKVNDEASVLAERQRVHQEYLEKNFNKKAAPAAEDK